MSRLHHGWLNYVEVSLEGSKVPIDVMYLCLKSFQSTFTCVIVKRFLLNFSENLPKSYSIADLFALFQRQTFLLTGFLRAVEHRNQQARRHGYSCRAENYTVLNVTVC